MKCTVTELGGLGATYTVHFRLIGKHIGDFLLVIIELFSLGAFVLSQYTRLTDRQTDRQNLDNNTMRMLRSHTVKMEHLGLMLVLKDDCVGVVLLRCVM